MQNTYSQNKEDLFVLNYFGDYKGNLIEIGANDGVTLSNSRLLIENYWKAVLVEPGDEYKKLFDLYGTENKYVCIEPYGIGDKFEEVNFWQSDSHVPNGTDTGLVSTTNFEETKRWPDVNFTEKEISLIPFSRLERHLKYLKTFDFISIDAEGSEWKILQQIDLKSVGCKCLCIEWNSHPDLLEKFSNYCANFGLNLKHKNAENLIFCVDKPYKIGVGVTTGDSAKGWLGYNFMPADIWHLQANYDQISVANDKNSLIKNMYDDGVEYFFIFDDDCFPIKEGWEQFFIDGYIKTGIQHFVLCNPVNSLYQSGNEDVSLYLTGTGCMLFMTRKVIDTVGYINPAYGKYGYEHVAYSHRIRMSGLTPAWYVSLNGWEEYIYAWDLDKDGAEKHNFFKIQAMTKEEKVEHIKHNESIFNKEVLSQQLYYDYK